MHCGQALFYEGDYYGREVNLASRVAARAGAGEVVVTGAVAELRPAAVEFERLGEIRLKGFSSPTEILLARRADGHV
jgi:adenylate cyclase